MSQHHESRVDGSTEQRACGCGGAAGVGAQGTHEHVESLLTAAEWQALDQGGTWGEAFAGEAARSASAAPRSAASSAGAGPRAGTRGSSAGAGARSSPSGGRGSRASASPSGSGQRAGTGAGASRTGSSTAAAQRQGASAARASDAAGRSSQQQAQRSSAARNAPGSSWAGFTDIAGTLSGAVSAASSVVNQVRPIVDLLANRGEPSQGPGRAAPTSAAPPEPATEPAPEPAAPGGVASPPVRTGADEPPSPEPMAPPPPPAPAAAATPAAAPPVLPLAAPPAQPALPPFAWPPGVAPQPTAGLYAPLAAAAAPQPNLFADPRFAAALAAYAQPAAAAAQAWAQLAAAGHALPAPPWMGIPQSPWSPPLPAAVQPPTAAVAAGSAAATPLATLLRGLQTGEIPSVSQGTGPMRDATALLSLILSNAQVQDNLRRAATRAPEPVQLSVPATTGAPRRDVVPLPMNAVMQAIAALAQRSSLELDEATTDEAEDADCAPAEFLLTESGDLIVDPEDPQRRADLVAHYFRCAAEAERNYGTR